MTPGKLFVISGPSGAGKGTLVARLIAVEPRCWLSVSATTRAPRPGEEEGKSYYFLSHDEFISLRANGGFLEWAEYAGNYYGTPKASVEKHLACGEQVILEIDVKGALQVREQAPEAHLVFIDLPSLEELERRLRGRGTETDEAIAKRLEAASMELSSKNDYDVVIVNDDLDEASTKLVDYVRTCAGLS